HAIGGMSAFIPDRRNPEVTENAIEKVREDKSREAADGFDGTWVGHPDLIPTARAEGDAVRGERRRRLVRLREDMQVASGDLLGTRMEGGRATAAGLRQNLRAARR